MRKLLLPSLLIFWGMSGIGQGFIESAGDLGVNVLSTTHNQGAGVSFYDFDKDGHDDLTFCLENDSLKMFRSTNGGFEAVPSIFFSDADTKHALWVDYDNDGDADLFVTRFIAGNILFNNDGNGNFTDVTALSNIDPDPTLYTFGASWGDYDKDGFLDVYVCNYHLFDDSNNWLLHNEGDGTFTEVAVELGVGDGSKPSFQSVWFDFNNDTWPDLYVINDKDPKNSLYKNNGDGTFTDVSSASGSDLSICAMCSAICDFDNDGDLDIYMTNDPSGNKLLQNNGDGTFDEVAMAMGLEVFAGSWGSMWIDHDNNLWDDIYVATTFPFNGNQNFFYMNADGEVFIEDLSLGFDTDNYPAFCNAKGDFNGDGYYDMVVTSEEPYLAKFFQNEGGENHYVRLGFEGVVSNRDAVGTWIESYIGGEKYVEYTMCGENFLSQDSQYEIISLGSFEVLDSLVLIWSSGLVESYYNLEIDQTHYFLEGATLSAELVAEPSTTICPTQSTTLSVGEYASYLWSTGETLASITTSEPGEYWVSLTDEMGFQFMSDTLVVTWAEELDYGIEVTQIMCYNGFGSIEILADSEELDVNSILWNTGSEEQLLDSIQAGPYAVNFSDVQGCSYSATALLTEPDSLYAEIESTDVSCFGGSDGIVLIEVVGGVTPYSFDWGNYDPLSLEAGNYNLVVSDSNSCILNLEVFIDQPGPLSIDIQITDAPEGGSGSAEIAVEGGTPPYTILWSNGESEVFTELNAGEHGVWVLDENQCLVYMSFTIDQLVGINELEADWLSVRPNPFSDQIVVSSKKQGQLELFDLAGKMVGSYQFDGNQVFDVSTLPAGTYLAVAISGPLRKQFKLVRIP